MSSKAKFGIDISTRLTKLNIKNLHTNEYLYKKIQLLLVFTPFLG